MSTIERVGEEVHCLSSSTIIFPLGFRGLVAPGDHRLAGSWNYE